jgi:hypothetical protein
MNIAFCKFAGMGNGGIEKYLQTIALIYHKEHNVDYYYTNAAPFPCQSWQHPDNDEQRIKLFEDNGINLIKIQVGYRIKNDWYNTNFTDLFDENKYDYLITAGNGETEYPYKTLKKIPIIHTVHGDHVFDQSNVKYYVLLCDWQAKRWIQNGGDASRLIIVPPVVYVPKLWNKNFRETIGIPNDAFVYGLHQRGDNSISSTISLEAFSQIQSPKTYYVIMGGGEAHRNYVRDNNIKNVIFIDQSSCIYTIHSFLDSIDVYAHCRLDGEVCSASIIEAMSHNTPIISYPGINMGHEEQLRGCGKMAFSVEEYKNEMIALQNTDYYNRMSQKINEKYTTVYNYQIVESKIRNLINGNN